LHQEASAAKVEEAVETKRKGKPGHCCTRIHESLSGAGIAEIICSLARARGAIAEDFAEFRKAGLTHPMMADIEKELGLPLMANE
jgi:hypothetical protein